MQDTLIENISDKKIDVSNPYPGLRPFLKEDSHLFFGRENQVGDVLSKLIENNFVAIIGKSGIGKSSFINCGILPKLYADFPGGKSKEWDVVTFRPGNDPVFQLSTALADEVERSSGKNKTDKLSADTINEVLHSNGHKGFSDIVDNITHESGKNMLLFIDQFEEVFRFKSDSDSLIDEVHLFIEILINSIKSSKLPLYVIITMRSDYIGECSKYPLLTSVINDSQFLIPQMIREEKRAAIVGPCKVMGAEISDELVNEILNKVGDDSVQLPVMQHALMRIWNYWEENRFGNEPLSLEHYRAVGGMETALSVHANEIFNGLSAEKKNACEKCFKSLTEKGAEGRSFRRPATIGELAKIAQASVGDIKDIVDNFRKPGRTLLTPPYGKPLDNDTIVDISHESLMGIWGTLENWMEEEYESTKQYLKIAEAAEQHQLGKGALLKSPELQMSTNWYYTEKPTKAWGIRHHVAYDRTIEYLLFSEKQFLRQQRLKTKQQKRRLLIARLIAIVFGAGAIIAGVLVVFALNQKEKAHEQRLLADEQAARAEEQTVIALSKEQEALRQTKIAESEALRALRNERSANASRKKAEEQTEKALEQEKIANKAREKAITEEQKALKLRMFSIARSMSVKSLQEPDITTKSLVSRQAYNFYFDNGGTGTDPDIYNALYYSVKALMGDGFNNLNGHTDNVRSIVTSASSDKFYSTSSDGRILAWTPAANNTFANTEISYNEEQVNKAMDLSSDGKTLIVAGDYPYLMIYDLADSRFKPKKIQTGSRQTLFLILTPDNKQVVHVGSNRKIMLYDFESTTEIAAPEIKLNALVIDPMGQNIVAGFENGTVVAYDMKNNYAAKTLYTEPSGNSITSLQFSDNGKLLAVGTIKGRVRVLNSAQGSVITTLTGHTARVNQICFNHGGNKLATASFDHTVRIWDLDNLYNQPVVLDDHKDWVWSIAFSKDDSYLFAGCRDKLVRAWILDIHHLANTICQNSTIDRNLSTKEWETYVADDIEMQCACDKNCSN